jgi:predicted outer membrane repeat protein
MTPSLLPLPWLCGVHVHVLLLVAAQTLFEDNSATEDAGALNIFSKAAVALTDTRFLRNSAGALGGAISTSFGETPVITIAGSVRGLGSHRATHLTSARSTLRVCANRRGHLGVAAPLPATTPAARLPACVCVRPQFVCENNTAPAGGCIYVEATSSVTFAEGATTDLRGNTADAISVQASGTVQCGNGSAWASPKNYTICGPACACNAAFVAGTTSDCSCTVSGARCSVRVSPARHASWACKRQAQLYPCPCA